MTAAGDRLDDVVSTEPPKDADESDGDDSSHRTGTAKAAQNRQEEPPA